VQGYFVDFEGIWDAEVNKLTTSGRTAGSSNNNFPRV
jgi:hypothetical protein